MYASLLTCRQTILCTRLSQSPQLQTLRFTIQIVARSALILRMDSATNVQINLSDDDSSASEHSDGEDPLCDRENYSSLPAITHIPESRFQRNFWSMAGSIRGEIHSPIAQTLSAMAID
jgi:hypothetical protein